MAVKEEKMLKFIWNVGNFSYCWLEKNEFIQSPGFEMNVFEGSSWCLKLCPRGVSCYENYISVHLERLASSKGPLVITVDYEMALLSPDGTAEFAKKTQNRDYRKAHAFGFDNLALRGDILGPKRSVLLPEDILIIQCKIFPKGTELESNAEIIAKTYVEIERSVFLWKPLHKFSLVQSECKDLHIRNFKDLHNRNTKKYAKLKLYWPSESLTICFFDHCPEIKVLRCKIGILDSNNLVSWVLTDRLIDNTQQFQVQLASRSEILKKKALYLPNDKLTLHCDFTFSSGVQHSHIEMESYDNAATLFLESGNKSPEIVMPLKNRSFSRTHDHGSFMNDFQSLYQDGLLCDFTLKVGEENIQVHKAVLAARSPVFKAMVTSLMMENKKNMVDISDLDANTVRHMLKFIYTDTIDELSWDTVYKLYFAADKYDIIRLRNICSSFIEQNLSVSNVGKALFLADLHSDIDLKNLVLGFISGHDTEVIGSTEWQAFMTEEAYLAAEAMRYVFMKKSGDIGRN